MASNLWHSLSDSSPYVLNEDRECVLSFNRTYSNDSKRLRLDSVPEPWVGNVSTAKVILLLSNPGHNDADIVAQQTPDLKSRMEIARREAGDFYPVDPKMNEYPVTRYWRPRLSKLASIVGLEAVRFGIAAIQFHAYHSVEFAGGPSWWRKNPLPSQEYGFSLVSSALGDSSKVVIAMRSSSLWGIALGSNFDRAIIHKNPRNTYLTPGNLGDETFTKVIQALR